MNNYLTEVKIGIAAFFSALSALLGWQGVMFFIWIAAMALDYLSGTLAAWLSGQWSSAVAREGLKHKGGMIFVVAVAGITDITLSIVCRHLPVEMTWPILVLPLVLGQELRDQWAENPYCSCARHDLDSLITAFGCCDGEKIRNK